MKIPAARWLCELCGAISTRDEFLVASHPFDPDDECYGCPSCLSIDQFVRACDLCDKPSCTGNMTPRGYAYLCADHDVIEQTSESLE